ncbi:unnamed protein product [Effrenium voratum]|uniref:GYF domain-containing protein n=1 Tax=Effrenium voratum TaxID=2562239 RepID=A0AA36NGP8_9DINO|nr:unnamed protein product [Effrenium voratum]
MPNIEVIVADQATQRLLQGHGKLQEVEVSPLEVNFSQHVIYPLFSDGTSVDETVREVVAIEEENDTSEVSYWLKTPFPQIQAVRWCPKLRDGEGKPVLDENGEERRGVEGLFALNNRRLYVLQRAAVYHYPRKCKVRIEVVTERWEVLHHLKKFRTRTNGLSIFVSEWSARRHPRNLWQCSREPRHGTGRDNTKHFDVLRVWDWRSAVAKLEEGGPEHEQAAESGSCACWEYLDPKGLCRGPYSNWQMQQWWEHGMLPRELRIRAFQPKRGEDEGLEGEEDFRPVLEVFEDAPSPFAPGWSPELTAAEGVWNRCAQCHRKRLDGWSARGQWYCSNCWRKWGA